MVNIFSWLTYFKNEQIWKHLEVHHLKNIIFKWLSITKSQMNGYIGYLFQTLLLVVCKKIKFFPYKSSNYHPRITSLKKCIAMNIILLQSIQFKLLQNFGNTGVIWIPPPYLLVSMVIWINVIVKLLMLIVLLVTEFTVKIGLQIFQSFCYGVLLLSIILENKIAKKEEISFPLSLPFSHQLSTLL